MMLVPKIGHFSGFSIHDGDEADKMRGQIGMWGKSTPTGVRETVMLAGDKMEASRREVFFF